VGTGSRTPSGGSILCLERASGDTVWAAGPDVDAMIAAFGPEDVEAAGFSCQGFRQGDVDGDGQDELVVRFCHGLHYPSCVCVIEADGSRVAQYANRGHLTGFVVQDVDADGTGPLDPAWLRSWLDGGSRFASGRAVPAD